MITKKLMALSLAVLMLTGTFTGCGAKQQANTQQEKTIANTEATDKDKKAATKLFKHFMGETIIPDKPMKVVVLSPGYEDYMIALGEKPIGASSNVLQTGGGLLPYLADKLTGVAPIGNIYGENFSFESIMALSPDLIIGSNYEKDSYEKLSKIAPTVLMPDFWEQNPDDQEMWKKQFRFFGDIFNKKEMVEKIIKEVDGKVADAKVKLEAKGLNQTLILLRMRPKGFNIYAATQHPVNYLLYKELGFKPSSMTPEKPVAETYSLEKTSGIDAKYIFLTSDHNASEFVKQMNESAIWKNLGAVKSGNVYETSLWIYKSWGPIGRQMIVDDILKVLLK